MYNNSQVANKIKEEIVHFDFESRNKKINPNICLENLIIFKDILEGASIPFGLIYGTLLGAVRENGFIEHDEDVDVYVLMEHRDILLNLIPNFKSMGFKVIRYDGNLFSIIRKDDYIDVYFFKKDILFNRSCGFYKVNKKHFSKTEAILFKGVKFNVPYEYKKLLRVIYGKDWITPKENFHAKQDLRYVKFVGVLKKILPNFIFKIFKKLYRMILDLFG